MSHPYLLVAAIATTFALVIVVALLLWKRFKSTQPTTPPTGIAAPALAAPLPRYASDEEWEAHAPYPGYALHAIHASEWATRDVPPSEDRSRSRDHLTFDDVEPFEPDGAPPFHRPDRQSTTDADFFSYAPPNAHHLTTSSQNDIARHCPHCNSSRIGTLNIGRKAGSTIGSVAGATSGMAMAFSGAEAGAAVGAIGGPLGSVFGGVAGAVIAGLLGSAAGCAAGSAVGAAIDENVLDNYRCMSCGHTFSAQPD
ncbi:hypothetical protein [Burkholderia ubonensis]|uniref:hypothetical protein n=1 Tax=Burkholderia ubonensis TaxID=101571 RepID=UPI000A442BC9|nr:hypothetical protein [Burkholderia ubonensis]